MLGLEPHDIPLIAWYVVSLVFLEGLLSADNALVLAVMVRHLPREQQRKALRYGVWGALGFRLVAVLMSALLLRFWWFKLVGGAYLIYLALAHFLGGSHDEAPAEASGVRPARRPSWRKSFWGTVISVELADVAFSIDSILAAVGMADTLPERFGDNWRLGIIYAGGVLGIVTMRFVAGYIIRVLERFPGLAVAAYALVGWIGVKLIASGLHDGAHIPDEIPDWLFWAVMAAIGVVGLFLKPRDELPPSGGAGLGVGDVGSGSLGQAEPEAAADRG
ncbi:Integral membrane protein TerC family protein [Aquisphaera giovannonii]|uniref:Integral membrane protein TerC family protein n=1 Tax=Aquisphaera giovannonii TaxID=406548 RepID=A0A5B9WBQ5_9BACT|nr:TerC family protein [Aquisphaera giovannonii]QEH38036.1 Integral membrane protein TerC family protein [Aquisphaera giovannonii]